MDDSRPHLPHRSTNYYEDENWYPPEHYSVKPKSGILKTNKLTTRKPCRDVNLPLNSSENVPVGKSLKWKDIEVTSEEHKPSNKRHATTRSKKEPTISEYELQVQKNIEERKKIFEMLELGNVKQEFEEIFANPNKRKLDENDDGNNNPVVLKRGRPLKKDPNFPPKNVKQEYEELVSNPSKRKLENDNGMKIKSVPPLQMSLRERNKSSIVVKEKHGMQTKKEVKKYQQKKKESVPPLQMSLRERKTIKYPDFLDDEQASHLPKPSKSYAQSGTEISLLNSGLHDAPFGMRLRQRRRIGYSAEAIGAEKTVFSCDTLSLKSTFVDQSAIEEVTQFLNELTPHLEICDSENNISVPNDLHEFVEVMKSFEISTCGVPSVVAKRITSLTWHPNTSRPLLAVGDIMGSIGLWDILHESETQRVSTHDIHASHVTGLTFDKFNPLKLISTSKDGYVRLLDFSTGTIEEIYSVTMTSGDSFPVNHIQKDPFSLLVSRANGHVVTIDMRTMPIQVDQYFKCFEGSIPTLSHHPLDENMFMASCMNGEVSIFDLRYMQPISSTMECTEPVYRLPHTVTRVGGAFFSPLTGDYALVTGKDSFEVFDLRSGITECQTNPDIGSLKKEHPALSNAVWHPNREDMCLATESGSGNLEVLGVPNGEHLHSFPDNGIRRQPGINAFHPSLPMLARGSRTNGRVYLYCSPVQ